MASYVQVSTEPLLLAVVNEGLPTKGKAENPKQLKEGKKVESAQGWKNKSLHVQFLRHAEELKDGGSWDWMKKGDFKKETKGLITAAQDQALRTNVIKAKCEKQYQSPLCRMCVAKDETRSHLICECSKLAQLHYKHWHGNMARILHWTIDNNNNNNNNNSNNNNNNNQSYIMSILSKLEGITII
mgnify:CR=1 FL=1